MGFMALLNSSITCFAFFYKPIEAVALVISNVSSCLSDEVSKHSFTGLLKNAVFCSAVTGSPISNASCTERCCYCDHYCGA